MSQTCIDSNRRFLAICTHQTEGRSREARCRSVFGDTKTIRIKLKKHMKMKSTKGLLGCLLAVGLCGFGLASAKATIEWDLGYEFSGGTTPSGPISIKIENVVGGVKLTIDLADLNTSEFVDKVYLN